MTFMKGRAHRSSGRMRAFKSNLVSLIAVVIHGAAVLNGCASVDPSPDYDRAVAEIRSATGVDQVYHPDEAESLSKREGELLADGLELREAVELGLLRNPLLQAAFRNVGLAKADRVQAGLLSNPSLAAALRFPLDGGRTQVEGALSTGLADLWQIPARSAVAQQALERSVFELAHAAVQLAGDLRRAYWEVLAAERQWSMAQENREFAARLVELVSARLQVAAATAIDKNLVDLELFDAEIALRDAELQVGQKRRRFVALLGYAKTPPDLHLVGEFPDSSHSLPELQALQKLAGIRRLDIRAATARLQQAEEELRRQSGLVFKSLQGGIEGEREDDWALGPAVRLEIPIFDQNQAQIAKAEEALAQQEALLRAVRISATEEVASAYAQSQAQWDAVDLYGDQVLLAQEAVELSQQSYQAGKATILPVIEAQRKLLSARQRLLVRLGKAAVAVSDLERAVGIPREELFQAELNQARK
ncbi:MAG: TolC family protein [Planctomycetota bacterium]|nr:MAG: TolC family protein [Planctomycetota bacterium]